MISKLKIQGFIHGSRLEGFPMVLTYVLVGMSIGYKESGGAMFWNALYVIPIFLFLCSITNILNALCDFESNVDDKETSSDRTMFDYGVITKSDIWNFVYFCSASTGVVSYLAFSHMNSDQQSFGYLNVVINTFLSFYYNLQPFRLKTKLFCGEFTVFFFFISIVNCSYFLMTGIPSWNIWMANSNAIILVVCGLIVNFYVDVEDDKRDGSMSSVIFFGETISKYLIIAMPIVAYILTIQYALQQSNIFLLLPLLTIPKLIEVIQLTLKKQKLAKPKFFLAIFIFNILFSIGILSTTH
ncbi:hypothetical protein CYY_005235 [Polysphondylium violaceum]|uniref:UbiA prenyltransferase family protein n=1 Tax=Polysphondylium violaceum TaxID=133409 RepID=A0A8J4PTN4_9MYCE|nr:hypothetical protein CYY_005235 [Polysphondylium violaceum]